MCVHVWIVCVCVLTWNTYAQKRNTTSKSIQKQINNIQNKIHNMYGKGTVN